MGNNVTIKFFKNLEKLVIHQLVLEKILRETSLDGVFRKRKNISKRIDTFARRNPLLRKIKRKILSVIFVMKKGI